MTFRSDYTLVFHPDPAKFPKRSLGEGTTANGHRIFRPEYLTPLYLDLELAPGTILLARSMFDLTSKGIASYQSLVFSNTQHSQWSHVAIVGTDGLIWDTNPGENVRRRSFAEFAAEADMLHGRKIKDAVWDIGILNNVLWEQSKSTYPQLVKWEIARYFMSFMANKRLLAPPFKTEELVCSSFVDRVIRETLSIEPFPEDSPPLALPGHFARSSIMECIPLAPNLFRLEDEVA